MTQNEGYQEPTRVLSVELPPPYQNHLQQEVNDIHGNEERIVLTGGIFYEGENKEVAYTYSDLLSTTMKPFQVESRISNRKDGAVVYFTQGKDYPVGGERDFRPTERIGERIDTLNEQLLTLGVDKTKLPPNPFKKNLDEHNNRIAAIRAAQKGKY